MNDESYIKKCVPCEGVLAPMSIRQVDAFVPYVSGWKADALRKSISKTFNFKTFLDSIYFVNESARIAEEEGHHPDMCINFDKVAVTLSTHSINGLSQNDFVIASKLNQIQ